MPDYFVHGCALRTRRNTSEEKKDPQLVIIAQGASAESVNFVSLRKLIPTFIGAFCILGLTSCSTTGDFGRRQPGIVAKVSSIDLAPSRINAPSSFTDDERELRNRIFALVHMPRPLSVGPISSLPDELDQAIGPDPDFYYLSLVDGDDRSPEARYRRLQSDIVSDRTLIPKFREIACRVKRMDLVREEASAAAPDLSEQDRSDVAAHVNENTRLIEQVETALPKRIEAYHSALQHLVAASPDREAQKTLADLNLLRAEVKTVPCGHASRASIIRKG